MGTGLFICKKRQRRLQDSAKGGDPMGHCDDARMDDKDGGVKIYV